LKTIKEILHSGFHLLRMISFGQFLRLRSQISPLISEPLLRAELFSATQMEQHGRNLAGRHQLSSVFGQDQLLSRLAENEVIIINTCHTLTEAIKSGHQATPAAVWLLDNTYLIEERYRQQNGICRKITVKNCRVCCMVIPLADLGFTILRWRRFRMVTAGLTLKIYVALSAPTNPCLP
jgi:hypothetical protein